MRNNTSGAGDRPSLRPLIISNISNFLNTEESNISETLEFVRFSKREYKVISDLQNNQIFTHINLQHYGIPYEFDLDSAFHAGIEILKNGVNTMTEHLPPILNESEFILLEQIGFTHSHEIMKPSIHEKPLMAEGSTIHSLLTSKYANSMRKTEEEISQMKYYTRTYKKINKLKVIPKL